MKYPNHECWIYVNLSNILYRIRTEPGPEMEKSSCIQGNNRRRAGQQLLLQRRRQSDTFSSAGEIWPDALCLNWVNNSTYAHFFTDYYGWFRIRVRRQPERRCRRYYRRPDSER